MFTAQYKLALGIPGNCEYFCSVCLVVGLYFVMLLFLIWNPVNPRVSFSPMAFRFLILIAFWGFSSHVHKQLSLYYVFIMCERYQLAVALLFLVARDIESLIHYVSLLSCSQGCEERTKCQYPCCHAAERWVHLGHVDSLSRGRRIETNKDTHVDAQRRFRVN